MTSATGTGPRRRPNKRRRRGRALIPRTAFDFRRVQSLLSNSEVRRAGGHRAFTLLEVLLTLAIIALLAGTLVVGSSRLMADKPVSPDEVFWLSVREARKLALKSEREVRLRFVDDKDRGKAFAISDGFSGKEFPILAATAGDLTVDFLSAQKGGASILVGGVLLEAQPVQFVSFYSDGTCSPFRVQIARAGGAHVLSIDQWTCAPVLTPADPYAPRP